MAGQAAGGCTVGCRKSLSCEVGVPHRADLKVLNQAMRIRRPFLLAGGTTAGWPTAAPGWDIWERSVGIPARLPPRTKAFREVEARPVADVGPRKAQRPSASGLRGSHAVEMAPAGQ